MKGKVKLNGRWVYRNSVTVCDSCGKRWAIGEWPHCPHGYGKHGHAPFTSYVDPHILPDSDPRAQHTEFNKNLGFKVKGTLIESREQRKALMKEQGLDWAGREHGTGGMEV